MAQNSVQTQWGMFFNWQMATLFNFSAFLIMNPEREGNYDEKSQSSLHFNATLGQQAVINQIVEYYQVKITEDMNDMVGHVINTVDAQNVLKNQKLQLDIEKLRCIVRIQKLLIQITKRNLSVG